jgi:hypothetical protein
MHQTAPTFARELTGKRSPFTPIFNVTGQPSLSIPCGFDRAGMPIGLMITGRTFGDAAVLDVAGRFEAATEGTHRSPEIIRPSRTDLSHRNSSRPSTGTAQSPRSPRKAS